MMTQDAPKPVSDLDKVAYKIQGLLNKANGGTTKEEAQALIEKAQELSIKHNVSMSYVEALGDRAAGGDKYVNFEYDVSTTISHEERKAAEVINKFFFVRVLWSKNRLTGTTKTVFVGTEVNTEIAKYAMDFLVETYGRLWREYRTVMKRKGVNVSGGMKVEFINGMALAVWRKLAAERAKFASESALMVITDKLDVYMKESHGKLKKHASAKGFQDHMDAKRHGEIVGRSIEIRKGMTASVDVKKLEG